jgi:hypothetical protein
VFRLNTNGTGFAVLHTFSGGVGDGRSPYAALIQRPDGSLLSTTSAGGYFYGTTDPGIGGTVFKINSDSTGFATIHTFSTLGQDGLRPSGRLLIGSDSLLYGVTEQGWCGRCWHHL